MYIYYKPFSSPQPALEFVPVPDFPGRTASIIPPERFSDNFVSVGVSKVTQ